MGIFGSGLGCGKNNMVLGGSTIQDGTFVNEVVHDESHDDNDLFIKQIVEELNTVMHFGRAIDVNSSHEEIRAIADSIGADRRVPTEQVVKEIESLIASTRSQAIFPHCTSGEVF